MVANRYNQNMKTVNSMSNLSLDWNGYGAKPIPSAVIDNCITLLNGLEREAQPHGIFPTARETIQFEYYMPDKSYLEFEIYEDRITVLKVPRRIYSSAIQFEFPITQRSSLDKVYDIAREFVTTAA